MKQGWEIKQLGEVCNLTGGGTPSKKIEEYYDGNILWATIRDMNEDILYATEHKITQIGLDNSSSNIIPKDNVIIATRVGLGKVCFLLNDTAINQDLKGIIPKNEDEIFNMFLFWWFKNTSEQIVKAGTGATVQGVKISFIQSLQFPLPPLDEQKRIVAKLDECFDAIDKARANVEKNLNNAKELFQSQLNQIFSQKGDGWVEKKLGEVCSVTSKLIDPKQPEYLNLLHIGGGNIVAETGELVGLKTSKDEKLKSGKFSFDDSMVLYNKIRPYLIKVVRPSFKGLCSADMYPLSPNTDEISRDYLYFLLVSKKFTDYAISGSARSGMPKVNRKHLFEFQCSFPSKYEQNNIIEQLDALKSQTQSLESNYQQELAALDELKKSILQKAFMGEL